MKKSCLFLCLAALFLFSSCMDTKYVTKKSTFDQVITQVSDEMSQQGFDLSGSSSETKNDLVVLRTSHTEESGYGTELANNFVTRDTYRFTNATGHSISYTVSYMLRETKKGEQYVDAAEIAACEVSDPSDYEKMCGSNSPIYQVNDMEKNLAIKVRNGKKTFYLASGLTLGGLVLLLIGAMAH